VSVAFESPQRLPATLRSLSSFDASREVAVCRELTKKFEEIVRGTASEVAARFAEPPKGEITLVVGAAASASAAVESEALAALAELVAAGIPRKRAAELVSSLTGLSRNTLYRGSL
jgi:16S rRNA (cytidine1402-2'-O)-methyltransferase